MSKIEWTEETWNPSTGCNKVSPGCKHCYAETMAKRIQAIGLPAYKNGFQFTLHPDRLTLPFKRKKPTTFFVNSMSDLFHEKMPIAFLDKVFDVMRSTHHHRYQVLTKRPERMRKYFEKRTCPENVWLGVSVEDKKYGVPRIDALRAIDCQVRFLSCEPLLEDLGHLDLSGIHWVIVGGESGKKARPMKQAWAEHVQRQCEDADVPFFFKQWGAFGADGKRRHKKANGRQLNQAEHNGMPKANIGLRL